MNSSKPVVLVFVSYYIPGFKAGGPIKTISHLVETLGDDFEFKIVTRDRDSGDQVPYNSVKVNDWNQQGKASVYYVASEDLGYNTFKDIISNTPHDILYLNSFFDPQLTLFPLLVRKRLKLKTPTILAPRGEFAPAALKIKNLKKEVFLFVTKLLGIHKGLTYQASSTIEAKCILDKLTSLDERKVQIAIDLPSSETTQILAPEKLKSDALEVIFLSRVSPMKNLDYALNVLKAVKGKVNFDIYGPIDDAEYWKQCQKQISGLPANIGIKYHGAVEPAHVEKLISKYDLFFLPTRGENYGHAIIEAISAGTKVLISTNTPWLNLAERQLGWDLNLNDEDAYVQLLNRLASNKDECTVDEVLFSNEIEKLLCLNKNIKENKELFLSQV
jgi:glycosyltransferase involved in cell wall biosynthesis